MVENTSFLLSCDAVLFDLDGVLIDSTGNIMRHWQAWADKYGVDINEINRVAHGLRTVETIRRVAPGVNAEIEAKIFAEYELLDTDGIVAINGASTLLASIPENAWGIVTSGCLQLVKVRMAKAGLSLPRYLVTADDVNQGKPSPEPYLTGASMVGVSPENCIVIEDAPAGIEAGKKAGMRVIAIASTHSREALQKTGADCIVDRLADLRITPGSDGIGLGIQVNLTT